MKRVFKSINDDEEDDPLQKQFKSLEMEWDSIKQSISRSNRRSSTIVAGDHQAINFHGECFDVDEESQVSTEFSCKGFENYDENYNQFCGFRRSCTGSPWSDAAERGGMVVAVKSGCGGSGGSVGKWIVCVVIVLFAVAIVAFECRSYQEHILVPT
ncbi:hypothetical protein L1987_48076 [Smallanthus sonchifolius]|uniref:Uncharacterized protein n=1 Tax=Smallanthus sonchifolius TaxID=185202 RepID=A0ACB9FS22_9ASTR|nr:hypothetical protein L1987_48076 [Smallanthus sonchifolius]